MCIRLDRMIKVFVGGEYGGQEEQGDEGKRDSWEIKIFSSFCGRVHSWAASESAWVD